MIQHFEEYPQHVEMDKRLDQLEILRSQMAALEGEVQSSLAKHYLPIGVVSRRTKLSARQLMTRIQDNDLAAVWHDNRWYILAESLEDSGYVE